MRSPADASPAPSRAQTHGLGPMWIATPSSHRTCTDYSLPISRRTIPSAPPGSRREPPWVERTEVLDMMSGAVQLRGSTSRWAPPPKNRGKHLDYFTPSIFFFEFRIETTLLTDTAQF